MLWLKRQLFKLYTRRQLKARQTALLMRKADLNRSAAPGRMFEALDDELIAVQRERIRRGFL
jgi:hypothetical protein